MMLDFAKDGFALHVDHNPRRQASVCENLRSLGLKFHQAPSPDIAKDLISRNNYRLLLMQMETMGTEIFPVCSRMREIDPHAVLIALVKRVKLSVEERLFECGINDVVTGRHTAISVLTKRIQAHLVNSGILSSPARIVRISDCVIDFDRREIHRAGVIHPLPGMLADLLKYFVENANRVISREELKFSSMWADSICASAKEGGKTFDVNVGKLRRIIESDPLKPEIITSVRGIGWKLTAKVT